LWLVGLMAELKVGTEADMLDVSMADATAVLTVDSLVDTKATLMAVQTVVQLVH
jgi:hypoxanthine phosphoribosyltransferase